jgi:hypothetical protein
MTIPRNWGSASFAGRDKLRLWLALPPTHRSFAEGCPWIYPGRALDEEMKNTSFRIDVELIYGVLRACGEIATPKQLTMR